MKPVIAAVLFVCILLSACSAGQVLPSMKVSGSAPTEQALTAQTIKPTETPYVLDSEGIARLFELNKDWLIAKLGDDYTTDPYYPVVYTYENLGIELVTELLGNYGNHQTLYCITALDGFEFEGTRNGMNFAQIMDKLGAAEIKTTWYLRPSNRAYEISYDYNNFSAVYRSYSETGENAQLVFWSSIFKSYETENIEISLPEGFSADDIVTSGGVTLSDIIFYLHDTPWDLFRHMGGEYKIEEISMGGDLFYDSMLSYDDMGISLYISDMYSLSLTPEWGQIALAYIDFNDICLNGINQDMSFDDIERRLGKGKRTEHNSDGEVPVVYCLTYTFQDIELLFYAYNENGAENSWKCNIGLQTDNQSEATVDK